MTLSFMRKVDDSLGMILCRILGWFLSIKHLLIPRKRKVDRENIHTILCQKYFGLGSILHAIPLIRALKEHFPNARIIFLTLESNREITQLSRVADEILTIQLNSAGMFVRGVFKTIVYLLRQRIDISIDLEFFTKFTMIVSFSTMARIRVGLHQRKIRPEGILTHSIYYNHYKHISDIYFAFSYIFDITRKQEYFTSCLPSFRDSHEKKLRERFGLKDEIPIVTINTNASELFNFRRWPSEYFIELIQLLLEHYPNNYYTLIGGESDYRYVEDIYRKTNNSHGRLINCAGKTSLEELCALIEMSYLMITNDSGPMHIASLYNVNIAVFFGPETPIVYGPVNDNALVFYSKDLYCSPCLSVYNSKQSLYEEKCSKNRCLMGIKPKEVFEAIKKRFFEVEQNSKG